jgi:fucose permease
MQQTTAGSGTGDSEVQTLRLFVFALFFMFGGITSLNDVIIPKLKALFTLNYAQAMLVQFAFFIAYLLISIPAAAVVARVGYMRTAALGLITMTAGCLLFIPASSSGMFGAFLVAVFVLGAGITIVQVVANPLISMLGRPQTAHSRLTFAQAFNSLGTTIFPYVGSILILGSLSQVDPFRGGAVAVPPAGDTGHRAHLHRPGDGADHHRGSRLAREKEARRASERDADAASLHRAPEASSLQLRDLMHLCLCGR